MDHTAFNMGTIITREALNSKPELVERLREHLGDTKPDSVYIGKYPMLAAGLDLPEGDKDYICALINGEWRDLSESVMED